MNLEYRHLNWIEFIWDAPLTPKAKLIANYLCHHTTKHHYICWPGIELIAEKTGYSRQATINGINELETNQWLKKAHQDVGSPRYGPIFPPHIEQYFSDSAGKMSAPKPPVTKTPKSTPKPAWELPDWINPQAWAEFEMHRRDLRKPLTDLGRTKAANTLNGLSHDQQQQCIDASIQAGWAGLFPKGAKGQDQQQTTGGLKTGVQPDGSYYDPEFGLCV